MSTTRKQFDEYNSGCHELSSVHSTELNSRQPVLYSSKTHSNHVRSCTSDTRLVLPFKVYYQGFFWVLIELIVELLDLIIKPFDTPTKR